MLKPRLRLRLLLGWAGLVVGFVNAMAADNVALGVDIGGSGIKGALVNLTTG